jgi:predicted peptidase
MTATGFIDKTMQMPDGSSRKYVVFVPSSYDPGKQWPAILFLHGAGERGDDNQAQVQVGIGKAIRQRQASFGFITIMPQCAKEKWWTYPEEKAYAMGTLARTRQEYNVDAGRIYLTGLSMGGQGTWALASDHPELWAAIVPICGPTWGANAAKIVRLPCWCFHGSNDDRVPVKMSREMIRELERLEGTPRYTEYSGVAHNSWDAAYGTDELYTWMLSQKAK